MSDRLDLDVAVIGGGVVGLACGMELASTREVAVIERRERAGLETSSHNSGVIHAGIYYPTGSLKHTLCLEGNQLLYAWIEAHDVPAARLGKLIVAVDESELGALEELRARAEANGVPGLSLIADRSRLRELEPAVRCVAALHSATSGVVDPSELMASFAHAARGARWLARTEERADGRRARAGRIRAPADRARRQRDVGARGGAGEQRRARRAGASARCSATRSTAATPRRRSARP